MPGPIVKLRRCCRCNGTAKCLRCACVRDGTCCSNCLPGVSNECRNRLSPLPVVGPTQPAPRGSPATTKLRRTAGGQDHLRISQPLASSPTPQERPSINTVLSTDIPTLHHVPKALRDRWARLLHSLFCEVCESPLAESGWVKLFMCCKCVMASPAVGYRLRWREILKLIRSRMARWEEGDGSKLWSEAVSEAGKLVKRRQAQTVGVSQKSHNIRKAKSAVQEGRYRKAIQNLTSAGVAEASEAVVREMRAKHPQSPPVNPPLGPVPSPIILHDAIVRKSVLSFPRGSAPGPSGLRPSHLREAITCPSPDLAEQFLSSLTKFVNLLASGQAPKSIVPHLCGATLLPCRKKSGGHRPIAIGEVLRRLVSKCLAFHTRQDAVSHFYPLQLGVGIPGGCEAIVHTVNHLMTSLPNIKRSTLELDFSNAFNQISREAMFAEFRQHLPGLSAWMESCYSSQPILHLGEETILSCCGVQQGDPLGPLGFALTLHPLVEHIQAEVTSLELNMWFLDDGTLIGPPSALSSALNIVENDGPPRGLHLNRGKSLLYSPREVVIADSPMLKDIPITHQGFILLGCPVGPASYCEDVLQARVDKIKESLDVLHDLRDSQLETTLLRSCLALPKLSYILRTCPPDHIRHAASAFDAVIRATLETILGRPMSEWSWLKASLPSSKGGINLRSAALHAPAAFIASAFHSARLMSDMLGQSTISFNRLLTALPALSEAASRPEWLSLEDVDVRLRQRNLSASIDEATQHRLLSSTSSVRDRALALSTAVPHAGDWLNCVPAATLGLYLRDKEFRCCLRYWLGVPLHSTSYTCPECHALADSLGDHQVGCGGNGDRITRHNAVRDVLYSAAQAAALGPTREAPGLVAESMSRPADIFLPTWHQGRPAALDVHIISPLQQQLVHGAASTPGHALEVGTQRKLASHLAPCRDTGVEFVPVVAETLGGLSEDTVGIIKSLATAISQRTDSSDPSSHNHLFQRVVVALWRGNACLWLHRQPPLDPAIDGIL